MESSKLKKYDDFIEAYNNLYHIQSDESVEESFNLITTILISKYQLDLYALIMSLFVAVKCNYRSAKLYAKILNQICAKYSITSLPFKSLKTEALSVNLNINSSDIIQFELDTKRFPKENEIGFIIMHDKIDKFKTFVAEKSIKKIRISIPCHFEMLSIEACCYYGSVNIFSFLVSSMNIPISEKCLELAFIGGNTDIINECMKSRKVDYNCYYNIIQSHNDSFLDFVFERNLFEPKNINSKTLIQSQNLKFVFLQFKKNKNSIIP
ncbi:hypothetical protein TVAG_221300 [Trichomonas vaginalis G3]|uniref:DUF3447 domain-containing protein n=1 Tax=Trichomonas vaginalis (strain ATCC PRA-98 / G3) TaxID=412133 RepID=A2FWY6_TRIV3|nr:spectrin binding [Trichomonas vaginalis G3]EAX90587.1 hypothetical protein TVAG_221300 [Trichomonas vaginalis G3]KAI5540262.1 spectrin binding [Trichomonas vaginalis G3]|eukprot:XP_001303517.1 hypothetical protein [Trichomonas vaginalis G3]